MSRATVNAICQTFPGAEVSDPWGGGHDAWKVGGKMFASIGTKIPGVSIKTDSIETALIEMGVGRKAPYFHRSWINVPWDLPEDELRKRLADSYRIVRSGLTRKAQASLSNDLKSLGTPRHLSRRSGKPSAADLPRALADLQDVRAAVAQHIHRHVLPGNSGRLDQDRASDRRPFVRVEAASPVRLGISRLPVRPPAQIEACRNSDLGRCVVFSLRLHNCFGLGLPPYLPFLCVSAGGRRETSFFVSGPWRTLYRNIELVRSTRAIEYLARIRMRACREPDSEIGKIEEYSVVCTAVLSFI